jgi:hypothetical protein
LVIVVAFAFAFAFACAIVKKRVNKMWVMLLRSWPQRRLVAIVLLDDCSHIMGTMGTFSTWEPFKKSPPGAIAPQG